jgi:gamma-glutamyl:cysteine ligase YbdK (ATP-grasp superfamily)
MSERRRPLPLFAAWGIELEYAIVRRDTLAVLPVADAVLESVAGEPTDYEDEPVAWSNELVLHVLELKTNGPTPSLAGWAERFRASVRRVNELLRELGGMLMPTAAHPLMHPEYDTRLWPHDGHEVYAVYDLLFDCHRHGWANLQSMHVNLPFRGDDEFARLHAAIRVVLPLLPALAASSPIVEGQPTGLLDTRLHHYRTNQRGIPAIAGAIVPEPMRSRREYEILILEPMYAAIATLDPEGLLRHEFLNSRGAIARFARDAIEIRLIDTQETPKADLAIAWLVGRTVRALVEERWVPCAALDAIPTPALAAALDATIRDGEQATIEVPDLLRAVGLRQPCPGGALWSHLLDAVGADDGDETRELAPLARDIVARGPLARRILARVGADPHPDAIRAVYRELCECLAEGRLFA